jgi:hypothetical protein
VSNEVEYGGLSQTEFHDDDDDDDLPLAAYFFIHLLPLHSEQQILCWKMIYVFDNFTVHYNAQPSVKEAENLIIYSAHPSADLFSVDHLSTMLMNAYPNILHAPRWGVSGFFPFFLVK